MYVGFKGAEPNKVNVYTKRGVESRTVTVAFLFTILKHLKPPFRALDEFNVHMDPKNRKIFSDIFLKDVKYVEGIQYIAITLIRIVSLGEDENTIIVKNMHSKSEVKVMG